MKQYVLGLLLEFAEVLVVFQAFGHHFAGGQDVFFGRSARGALGKAVEAHGACGPGRADNDRGRHEGVEDGGGHSPKDTQKC